MTTKFATVALFGLGMAFTSSAWAGPADDACAALMDARGALVSMVDAKDKASQDALNAKVQAASAKLDGVLAAMAGGDAAKAAAFKPVWADFVKTRQTEIIPAIYAGKVEDAKKLASGIQAERMGKMKSAMGCK